MSRIDLREVLRKVGSERYQDLVTRPTGKVVRGSIEAELQSLDPERVAIIDFSAVGCMDFSCADEIVAKLMLAHGRARYFLLRGISPMHREAIEAVLERHELAVIAEDRSGQIQLLGPLPEPARRVLAFLLEKGAAAETEVREHLATTEDSARRILDDLRDRRLIRFAELRYEALTAS